MRIPAVGIGSILITLIIVSYPLAAVVSVALNLGESSLAGITVRALTAALSCVVLLRVFLDKSYQRASSVSRPTVVLWLFLFVYGLRLLWDIQVVGYQLDQLDKPGSYYLLFYFLSAVIPTMAVSLNPNGLLTSRSPSLLYIMVSLALALNLALSLETAFTHSDVGDVARLASDKMNPISLGHLAVAGVLLSMYMFFYRRPDRPFQYLLLVTTVLGLVGVVLANSRGPFISLVIPLAVMLVARFGKRAISLLVKVTILVAVFLGLSVIVERMLGIDFFSRLIAISNPDSDSINARVDSIGLAMQDFLGKPIFGNAFVIEGVSGYPHNISIEVLMATGLIGGLLYVVLVFLSFKISFQIVRRRGEYIWIVVLFLQNFVGGQFSGAIWSHGTTWAMMALLFVAKMNCIRSSLPRVSRFRSHSFLREHGLEVH